MKDRWSLLALAVLIGGLVLVAYALMTPVVLGGGHQGEISTRTAYELLNLVLAILGTAMVAVSGTLLITREMSSGAPSRHVDDAPAAETTAHIAPASEEARLPPVAAEAPDDHRLILRLLNGDEREVFRSLVDAGGEQLQRDIVAGTKMSDAKVSRVLDRLEEKGLVARERRGMGNMVRIAVDRAS